MRDMYNNLLIKRAISPLTQTNDSTAIVSQIIDRLGFEAVLFAIATGSLSDTDVTFVTLLEESDDGAFGTSNAVADADLLGTEVAASFQYDDDNEVRKLGYIGTKRYLRLTITPTGNNSGSASISSIAILGNPTIRPVTQSAS